MAHFTLTRSVSEDWCCLLAYARVSSLLKNGSREGEAPAEPRETSDFPHAHGSAGASPSLFQQAVSVRFNRVRYRPTRTQTPSDSSAVRARHPGSPRQRSRPPAVARLSQHQLNSLDMRRVMRFEQQRPPAHRPNPLVGQMGRIQKPARPLNPRQPGGHGVRDGEARSERHRNTHRRAATCVDLIKRQ